MSDLYPSDNDDLHYDYGEDVENDIDDIKTCDDKINNTKFQENNMFILHFDLKFREVNKNH